jgi:N-acyl amino acid synthase of PEP-CTERM/exosortase system
MVNGVQNSGESGSASGDRLIDLYDRYFIVLPADTPDLLDAAHALRYQVYCVEHPFENPAQQVDERETDQYDAHSVHAVLIAKATGRVVGCVRLILPAGPDSRSLPIRDLLTPADQSRLDQFDTGRTAEISRYAISKLYRRRQGESFYPDVDFPDLPPTELRRLVPHMSLGLLQGVARVASSHGITTVCAAMAPPLLRLLEQFGMAFERLGPLIDCHGMRQPCIAECEQLLAGMADRNPDYYRIVAAAYHESHSRPPSDG